MVELRTPRQVDEMRPAGAFVAEALATLAAAADVGVNLLDLDGLVHDLIRDRGAESSYIDYHPSFGASPFGKVLCTSVNDAVLHGLPHDYRLRDGDLLSLDFACAVDGWVADSALSLVVGTPDPRDLALIDATERALAAAIAQAVVGNRLGDISAAIGDVARAEGLPVNLQFGGHGVGRTIHEPPDVPNYDPGGRSPILTEGLVLAIEPLVAERSGAVRTARDRWTIATRDGGWTAHWEHTIVVTSTGALVLTAQDSTAQLH